MYTLAYSQNKVKEEDWNCLELWRVSYDHPSTYLNLSQASSLAPLAPWCSSTLEWEVSLESRVCSGEEQSQPRHGPSYENGWKIIARACVDSPSEVVWNSDGSGPPPHNPCRAPSLATLNLLQHCSTLRWGCQCLDGTGQLGFKSLGSCSQQQGTWHHPEKGVVDH